MTTQPITVAARLAATPERTLLRVVDGLIFGYLVLAVAMVNDAITGPVWTVGSATLGVALAGTIGTVAVNRVLTRFAPTR